MHIAEVFRQSHPAISFEFFPPRSEAASEALFHTIQKLIPLKPAYVSVTYGAGGSTRELTHDLVVKLHRETNLTIVSHLTCVKSRRDEIFKILQRYDEHGIQNIMALRGDPPTQEPWDPDEQDFRYAVELVAFIKKHFPHMGIGVAGFPKAIPTPPTVSRKSSISRPKSTPGPTTSARNSFSTIAISMISANGAGWPESAFPSSRASCPSPHSRG